jgi:hypothetical protein
LIVQEFPFLPQSTPRSQRLLLFFVSR